MDISVKERLVYTASQLCAFVDSELTTEQPVCCSSQPLKKEMVEKVIASLVGKIWSAKVFAQKPSRT